MFCDNNCSHLKSMKEIVEILNYFETKYSVDEWIIDDVYIWPILRKLIAEYFIKDSMAIKGEKVNRSDIIKKILYILKSFKVYFYDYSNNDIINGKRDVCFLMANVSRNIRIEDGKAFSTSADVFYEKCKKELIQTILIEKFDPLDLKLPRYSKSIFYNFFYAIGNLLAVMNNKFAAHSNSLKGFDSFKTDYMSYGLPSNLLQIKYLQKYVQIIKTNARIFEILFRTCLKT